MAEERGNEPAPEGAPASEGVVVRKLVICNRKGLHARSEFPARHDGSDRWLQRTYLRRSLWSIRYRKVPGDRRVH